MSHNFVVVNLKKLRAHPDGSSSMAHDVRPSVVYHDEGMAIAAAQELATSNPKCQIAVFKAVSIFETKAPTFIEKMITESGELIPK